MPKPTLVFDKNGDNTVAAPPTPPDKFRVDLGSSVRLEVDSRRLLLFVPMDLPPRAGLAKIAEIQEVLVRIGFPHTTHDRRDPDDRAQRVVDAIIISR